MTTGIMKSSTPISDPKAFRAQWEDYVKKYKKELGSIPEPLPRRKSIRNRLLASGSLAATTIGAYYLSRRRRDAVKDTTNPGGDAGPLHNHPHKKKQEKVAATKDVLTGGLADGIARSEFPKAELKKGIKHELEHTKSRQIASEVARDHLSERPDYYTALAKAKIG